MSFKDSKHVFIVERQFKNFIRVIGNIPTKFYQEKYINLITICDKQFITCCKKYDNAVNFRGEPFAPVYVNLLK